MQRRVPWAYELIDVSLSILQETSEEASSEGNLVTREALGLERRTLGSIFNITINGAF